VTPDTSKLASTSSSDDGLSGGVIAGIANAAFVVLAVMGFFVVRRSRGGNGTDG